MKISLPENSRMMDSAFEFGVSTSSFQIEGAANQRLDSIWDTFCKKAGAIADGSDGLVACDHFHLWKQDLDLIKSLGVDIYRFSLSWPRLVNRDGTIRKDGLAFYRAILDYLKQINIKAYVTLYHWDLPQYLEDDGGWLNRNTADAFAHYADVISQQFGELVDSWSTLNEPFCSAYLGYETGIHAPGIADPAKGRQAAHNLLLAHGKGMQVLQRNCPHAMNGIVLNLSPCYPDSDSDADRIATQNASEYLFEWFLAPLVEGNYPAVFNKLPEEIQPDIHDGDMEIISTPIDFLGLNYYTRDVYKARPDTLFERVERDEYPKTDMGWEVYPQGLTDLLVGLNDNYDLPPLYITENGAAMPGDTVINGSVHDPERLSYLHTHINAVHEAMEQGVDMRGYFAWSLMDNFEWAEGYMKRFGIVHVDYETQKRTIKDSGLAYRDFLLARRKRLKQARGQ